MAGFKNGSLDLSNLSNHLVQSEIYDDHINLYAKDGRLYTIDQTGTISLVAISGDVDLSLYPSFSYVNNISGNLQSQIDNLDLNYATDASLIAISGNLQSQLNNIDFSPYTLITTVDSISGNLQSQINNLDSIYATDASLISLSGNLQNQIDNIDFSPYATFTYVNAISGNLQTQINNLDGIYATDSMVSSISGILQNNIDNLDISDTYSTLLPPITGSYTFNGYVSTVLPVNTINSPVVVKLDNSHMKLNGRVRIQDVYASAGTNKVTITDINDTEIGKLNTDDGAIEFSWTGYSWQLIDKFENIWDRDEVTSEVTVREGETLVAHRIKGGENGITFTKTVDDATNVGANVDQGVSFGNIIIATEKTVSNATASGSYTGSGASVIDNNTSSAWTANGVTSATIVFDFGTTKTFSAIDFLIGVYNGHDVDSIGIIEGSADNVSYSTFKSGNTDLVDGDYTNYQRITFVQQSYRYVRVTFNEATSYPTVKEVKFYDLSYSTASNASDIRITTGTYTVNPSSFLIYDQTSTAINGTGNVNIAYSIDGGAFTSLMDLETFRSLPNIITTTQFDIQIQTIGAIRWSSVAIQTISSVVELDASGLNYQVSSKTVFNVDPNGKMSSKIASIGDIAIVYDKTITDATNIGINVNQGVDSFGNSAILGSNRLVGNVALNTPQGYSYWTGSGSEMYNGNISDSSNLMGFSDGIDYTQLQFTNAIDFSTAKMWIYSGARPIVGFRRLDYSADGSSWTTWGGTISGSSGQEILVTSTRVTGIFYVRIYWNSAGQSDTYVTEFGLYDNSYYSTLNASDINISNGIVVYNFNSLVIRDENDLSINGAGKVNVGYSIDGGSFTTVDLESFRQLGIVSTTSQFDLRIQTIGTQRWSSLSISSNSSNINIDSSGVDYTVNAISKFSVDVHGNTSANSFNATTSMSISGVPVATTSYVNAISSNLQSQLNNIVQETTSISGDNTLVIGQTGANFSLSVADYISATKVYAISGDLQSQINSIDSTSNVIAISGELQALDNKFADYATISYVNDISGNLQSKITNNDNDISTLQSQVTSISANFDNYATNVYVLAISGDLQNKIDNIERESTAISGDNTLVIGQTGANFSLSVADYISATEVYSISGDLQAKINDIPLSQYTLNSTTLALSGQVRALDNKFADYATISYVNDISGDLQNKITNNDNDISTLQSQVTSISANFDNYTLLTTTVGISSQLNNRLISLEFIDHNSFATNSYVNNISSNLQTQVTSISSNFDNYASNVYVLAISGDLQSKINAIEQESTSISGNNTLIVNKVDNNFSLSVADYISATEVYSISGDLQAKINEIDLTPFALNSNVLALSGQVQALNGNFVNYSTISYVNDVSGALQGQITSNDNDISVLQSRTTSISSNFDNYASNVYVLAISGDLQTKIDNIEQESTAISGDNTLNVNKVDNTFSLSVADYISATEVYAISGDLQTKITNNDNDISTLQSQVTSISANFDNYTLLTTTVGISSQLNNRLISLEFIDHNSFATTSYVDGISGDLQSKIDAIDLTPFASNAYVLSISGNLQTQINNIESNYSTISYVNGISGNLQGQITSNDGDISTLQSQVTSISSNFDNYATNTYVLAISGNLQSQISNLDSIYATDSMVANISSGLNDRTSTLEERIVKTGEPRGFENITSSTLSFNESTLTFNISGSFNIWQGGVKYAHTSDTQVITNTTGSHFLYYNASNVFTYSMTPWDILVDVPIALVYWDSITQKGILVEERHGIVMDSITHNYLHSTRGTQLISVGALSGYTPTETNPTSAGQTYGIGATTIADEDLITTTSAFIDGSTYTCVSRTGSSTAWTITTGRNLPFLVGAANSYIAYNLNTGGTWSLAQYATTGATVFGNYYLVAIPAIETRYQYVLVPGQATYSTLALAQGESPNNLDLTGFPFAEFVFIYRISYRYSQTYTATNRGRIEAVASINSNVITSGIVPSTNHNSLNGLQGGTTSEYFHLTASEYSDLIGTTEVNAISGDLQTQISNVDEQQMLSLISNCPIDSFVLGISGINIEYGDHRGITTHSKAVTNNIQGRPSIVVENWTYSNFNYTQTKSITYDISGGLSGSTINLVRT